MNHTLSAHLRHLRHIVQLVIAIAIGYPTSVLGLAGGAGAILPLGPDTVDAVVVYGAHSVFGDEGMPGGRELDHLLHELCQQEEPPEARIRDLRIMRRVQAMDADAMLALIDSLLSAEEEHYALINEVSLYLGSLPASAPEMGAIPWYSPDPVPGGHLYGEWHTDSPNAYHGGGLHADSIAMLELVREECGAHAAAQGVVTSRFGRRHGRPHNGIDIGLRTGDPVHSMFPGVVRFAGSFGSFGRIVVVRHWNGLETYYAHLHRVRVTVGQEVEAGHVIGLSGSSGRSTGPHLHLEVRFNGRPVDPCAIMDPLTGKLTAEALALRRTRWSYVVCPPPLPVPTHAEPDHNMAQVR